MDRHAIANVLERHGFFLELDGENPFKVRAYRNAARELRRMADFEERIVSGTLAEVHGFGKVLVEKVTRLAKDEIPSAVRLLDEKYPPSLVELRGLRSLGAKRVRALYEKLGIASAGELEYACRENRLAALSGFGGKTQEKILRALEFRRAAGGRLLLPEAEARAEAEAAVLRKIAGVIRVAVAGEVRRRRETVDGIDLVVEVANPEALAACRRAVAEAADRMPVPESDDASEEDEILAEPGTRFPVRLHEAAAGRFGIAMLRATGSAEFLSALLDPESEAKLDSLRAADEERLFGTLLMEPVPPELREDGRWLDAARRNALPRLVEPADLCALFHVHTDASDGRLTLRENLEEIRDMGYGAVGISDHSKTAAYAGGLDAVRVRAQREEIEAIRPEFPELRIYHGTESDILADGSLDFDEETLAAFDFVVASVHSRFGMSREEMTARLVAAVRNPYTTILGHPTGRLLLSRPAYDVDLGAVIRAAVESGCVVEANASPNRLDIDWRTIPDVLAAGGMIAIDPDAHSLGDLHGTRYGVDMARKGGATAKDVWNAGTVEELDERIRRRRSR